MTIDPAVIAVPSGAWLKVATNVTTGRIHILDVGPAYRHTYRLTGTAAPTLASEGALVNDLTLEISATSAIDVYLYTENLAGRIRADL